MRVNTNEIFFNSPRFITLEEAGYEEDDHQPLFGAIFNPNHPCEGSVVEYVNWFYDGELDFSVM